MSMFGKSSAVRRVSCVELFDREVNGSFLTK